MNLYQITEEVNALESMIINDAGEFTEDHEKLQNYVNCLLASKVDNFVHFLQKQEDMIEIAKKRKDELTKMIKQREMVVERLESYVIHCLKILGKEKLEGNMHYLKLRKPSAVVEIIDEQAIPENFVKIIVERKIDKMAIKEQLKNGTEVKGAILTQGKEGLVIK